MAHFGHVVSSPNAGFALAAWCAGLVVHRVCACEHISLRELRSTLVLAMVGGAVFWRGQPLGHWSAEAVALAALLAGAVRAHEINIAGPSAIAPADMVDMGGKVVVVTGASHGGIGFDTALAFARAGAKVVICLRNEKKAQLARDAIVAESGNKDVTFELLDLASLSSVQRCAAALNERLERVDVLVNNAGLMTPERSLSSDGVETNLQVNCLAPLLLSVLLLPSLRKSALPHARVINVSSSVHKAYKAFGSIDVTKLSQDNGGSYGMFSAYSRSKFLFLALSNELNARLRRGEVAASGLAANLESRGLRVNGGGETPVIVNSVMPGCIATAISQNMPWWAQIGHHWIVSMLLKNCEQGARSTVFVATAKSLEGVGGEYFEHCARAPGHKDATDNDLCQRIWKWAEDELETSMSRDS